MIPDVTPNGVFYLPPTGWLTSFYNPPNLNRFQKQLLRKKFGIIIHHLKRTKADLKRELQKQYKVEDNPLYMTYGRQHSISVSIDNLTEEKLQDYLKNAEYLGSKDYTIRSSDASLIELFIKKDYYKKS